MVVLLIIEARRHENSDPKVGVTRKWVDHVNGANSLPHGTLSLVPVDTGLRQATSEAGGVLLRYDD